jgi:hypothetical protein
LKRSRLRRISARRLFETDLYRYRVRLFLLKHPYCQVWLAERGIEEEWAKAQNGLVCGTDGVRMVVPLATQVHHRNKRRGADLLDQTEWLAVSREAHAWIENHKDWARARGFLRDF